VAYLGLGGDGWTVSKKANVVLFKREPQVPRPRYYGTPGQAG
jgi:hypothetical protein